MQSFEYADDVVNRKEMTITVMSMMIGVGILTLPRTIARHTHFSDGWLSIVLAGAIASAAGLLLALLAVRMGKDTYYRFASKAIGKPAAAIVTAAIVLYALTFTAYEVRAIATISKQYLFTKTPMEMIGLAFLLLVVYAAAGSKVALIRLNVLFLPLVAVVTMLILLLSGNLFQARELFPVFTTPPAGILSGAVEATTSLLGFEIILFYGSMLSRPKDAVKSVLVGLNLVVLLYLFIYLLCVGVFAHDALSEVQFPAIELAKEAKIPGRFFERLESVFFIMWIMTIFNTASMAVDVGTQSVCMLLKRKRSPIVPIVMAPMIYLISMAPRTVTEFEGFSRFVGLYGGFAAVLLPIGVLVAARMKDVKSDEQG